MEIKNLSSVVSAYKSIGTEHRINSGVKNNASVKRSKNVDVVEFSSAARSENLSNAKAAVKKYVESSASDERIAALKAKIADGSYAVSPENVAAAIFEG